MGPFRFFKSLRDGIRQQAGHCSSLDNETSGNADLFHVHDEHEKSSSWLTMAAQKEVDSWVPSGSGDRPNPWHPRLGDFSMVQCLCCSRLLSNSILDCLILNCFPFRQDPTGEFAIEHQRLPTGRGTSYTQHIHIIYRNGNKPAEMRNAPDSLRPVLNVTSDHLHHEIPHAAGRPDIKVGDDWIRDRWS